jgi:hypothetical protein
MKTKPILLAVLACAALLATGCTSIPAKLEKFEKLGVTELSIPGRVTNTDYRSVEEDGVVTDTLEHSNPWLIKPARVVRKRPAAK